MCEVPASSPTRIAEEVYTLVINAFAEFTGQLLLPCGIGDQSQYPPRTRPGRVSDGYQYSLNQYVKCEGDVLLKFGWFLERSLWTPPRLHPYLAIHAQIEMYPDSNETADLSIHRITPGSSWRHSQDAVRSCLAAIEIKYLPWGDFRRKLKQVRDDIEKLHALNPAVLKFVVALDEACQLSGREESIPAIANVAGVYGVSVLSNNPALQRLNPPTCTTDLAGNATV